MNLGRSGARDSIRLGINWQTPSPLCSIPARSLGGGSGGEERLIIEWMVIERNVLRTPKYNAKTTIKYTVEPHYGLG